MDSNVNLPKPKNNVPRPTFSKYPWNDGIIFDSDTIQNSTNCYAYACNDPNGHGPFGPNRPHPGQRSGLAITENTGEEIAKLSEADGLYRSLTPNPKDVEGYYVVALTMSECDYHWYRRDADGSWSHKLGNKVPKNTDESGNTIYDLENADRGRYKDIIAYFYVPNEGIRVGEKGRWLLENGKITRDEEVAARQNEAKEKIIAWRNQKNHTQEDINKNQILSVVKNVSSR